MIVIGGWYEGNPTWNYLNFEYSFETKKWQDFKRFDHYDRSIFTPGLTVIRHEQMIYAVFYMGGPKSNNLWAHSGEDAQGEWEVKYTLEYSHGNQYQSIAMIPYIP